MQQIFRLKLVSCDVIARKRGIVGLQRAGNQEGALPINLSLQTAGQGGEGKHGGSGQDHANMI